MTIDKLNLLPAWRSLGLGRISMLRNMIKHGHPMYASEARQLIKAEQCQLAKIRAALKTWTR